MTKDKLMIKVTAAGLDDAQIFEAIRFAGLGDFVKALYPDVNVVLEPDAEIYSKILLCTAADRSEFARRLENDGLPGGLSDSLWAAGVAKEKAKRAEREEPLELFPGKIGKTPVRKGSGALSWRPTKRPKTDGGMASADLALVDKWGARLGKVLQGTPSATLASEAADPHAFFLSLVGKARPATIKKRVRDWELFCRWLAWTEGRSWPTCIGDAMGYLNARLSEGCPASFSRGLHGGGPLGRGPFWPHLCGLCRPEPAPQAERRAGHRRPGHERGDGEEGSASSSGRHRRPREQSGLGRSIGRHSHLGVDPVDQDLRVAPL